MLPLRSSREEWLQADLSFFRISREEWLRAHLFFGRVSLEELLPADLRTPNEAAKLVLASRAAEDRYE